MNLRTFRTNGQRGKFELLEDRCMLTASADVMFFFDESDSSGQPGFDQRAWLEDFVLDLDQELTDVDARYGLVGFGGFPEGQAGSAEFGHAQLVDPTDSNQDGDLKFGTASQLSARTADLTQDGGGEVGWDALEHGVQEYDFRPGAAVIFVLVQNEEGRTTVAGTIDRAFTHEGVLAMLDSQNVSLTSVVEAGFDPAAGSSFYLGVEAPQTGGLGTPQVGWVLDPGLTQVEFVDGTDPINGAAGSAGGDTDNDYVRLAWETGGSAWNIDVVRNGTTSEVDIFNTQIAESIHAQIDAKIADGDVAFAADAVVEINLGGPDVAAFQSDTTLDAEIDALLGVDHLTFTTTNIESFAPDPAPIIASNGRLTPQTTEFAVFESRLQTPQFVQTDFDIDLPTQFIGDGSYVVEFMIASLDGGNRPAFSITAEGVELLNSNYTPHRDFAKVFPADADNQMLTDRLNDFTPIIKRYAVDVSDGDGLQITLSGNIGLNGLRILEVPAAPQVIEVTLSGANSTHPAYDFSAVDGSGDQLMTVPVGGADTIEITFSKPIDVATLGSGLTLVGAFTGNDYSTDMVFQGFDNLTNTATWEYTPSAASDQFPADQMVLTLADTVTDTIGLALDGEWTNPLALGDAGTSVFPSGNDEAGGDFMFFFTVLPADFDVDNMVGGLDLAELAEHFNEGPNSSFADGDADGDGSIGGLDLSVLADLFNLDFTSWPA